MPTIEENKNEGAVIESAEQGKQEKRETNPLARLEAMRVEALGGTKSRASKDTAEGKSRIHSGVEAVKGTEADIAAISQEVAPLEAQREEVVQETEQRVEQVVKEPEPINEPSAEISQVPIVESTHMPTPEASAENPAEKLRLEYRNVTEKIKAGEEQLADLEKQRNELFSEKRQAEGAGDKAKLQEIDKKLEANSEARGRLEEGDKLYEINKRFREQDAALYDEITKLDQERGALDEKKIGREKYTEALSDLYDKKSALRTQREALYEANKEERSSQLEKWDENGLESFRAERQKLVLEFKKQNGYDETLAREARERLGFGAADTDADRAVLNKYLGLELPLISKDLRLKAGSKEGQFDVVDDNSPDGTYNTSLLVQKRAELFLKAQQASEAIKGLSPEVRAQIISENQLEWDAINKPEYHAGSRDLNEHWQNKNISDVFTTFVGGRIIYGENRLAPGATETMKKAGFEAPVSMSHEGDFRSVAITRALFIEKLAREKGLI